ncbi:hypothetical protein KM1_042020 [Entamoeba histolytica HM-3:IMSS]|uniref:Uncharacterized protein n=5 Tax=Entamoeba histolytica TaxID=5759 RepID=C4M8W9_ENTH1|nr:hypothetical protein EHI_120580 [Entamoeba histolytica HM-1:IMSS]EMD46170.1 Hypothetical protein EHI5A_018080 [Entamoeba histolytica KU27]EMS12033.1 hypothetical protein KM1_042020 [Entamoeba histolytica HM-3:IMSS]ENY65682.1 hypothetical protein EHI7A_031820 [Entamoeba histolytica HM-1:IMSS-A]GAT98070.1 hypothetical protein CL6EHI_120580 [Entamoeba histolytica]EAL46590.1 hypothetical protein EHI_120580 [Entamoeba histolytica HM-1:IMSS]|eukprot:XP_651978.1 hypothetical protein EHI_120580 [Entamoeba histolytica HM-1:IMSS]
MFLFLKVAAILFGVVIQMSCLDMFHCHETHKGYQNHETTVSDYLEEILYIPKDMLRIIQKGIDKEFSDMLKSFIKTSKVLREIKKILSVIKSIIVLVTNLSDVCIIIIHLTMNVDGPQIKLLENRLISIKNRVNKFKALWMKKRTMKKIIQKLSPPILKD